MMTIDLTSLVRIAGIVHLAIAAASLAVPRVLDWPRRLSPLDPFHRRLFWVYAFFILLTNVGFGLILLLEPHEIAGGGGLGRLVAGLIAVYWLCRVAVQWFVFDTQAVVQGPLMRVGYHALTLGFLYLAAVCGWAALGPLWR